MIVDKSDKELPFKLHELRCFDAVARLGSFQAAATSLHRTHPSVFTAVQRLEERLGLTLLDRGGYRVGLTEAGKSFHAQVVLSLRNLQALDAFAGQLAQGVEPVLRVVLGDLCPRSLVLPALSRFFAAQDRTRLHLDYEAVAGPVERLRDGTADLVIHRAEVSAADLEQVRLRQVQLIPVAAPGFLPFDAGARLTPSDLEPFIQCVIRDTSGRQESEEHFLIEGAPQCSVSDHGMKKELILQRMAWGHLPDFMIEEELRTGALLSIRSADLPGRSESLALLRRRDRAHGPVARELWDRLTADLTASAASAGGS
jgi:DNA-binding transcriptional LysR family regulator